MKRLSIFILVAFLMGATSLQAQVGNDILTLKDGSIIRGTITERIANSHVRILTAEGAIKQFSIDEVENVKMVGVKEAPVLKPIGYFNSTGIGVMVGSTSYNKVVASPSFRTVNGITIGSRWQLGLGTGMEVVKRVAQVPIFFEGRYHLLKGDISPFVGVQAGYQFGLTDSPNYYYYDYDPNMDFKRAQGVMVGSEVGIRNLVKKHFGYSVSLGYRMQQVNEEVPLYFGDWNNVQIIKSVEHTTMHRLCLSFAFLFN
jgi:hypothetical protein